MNKRLRLILLLVVLNLLVILFFKDDIAHFFDSFKKSVEQFQKVDLGKVATQVGHEILTPPPLNIGGTQNAVVFAKAKIIAETNVQRYNNGQLLPLIENAKLDAAAKAKAEDMFANQYFEHISPTGVGPAQLAKNVGYAYIVYGENLILGNFDSEKQIVQAWMDSPGHRANILNTRYIEIGVAIIKGTYQGKTAWIGVQEFGLPLSTCPTDLIDSLKKEIDDDKAQGDSLVLQIQAKKAQIDNTKQNSPQYNVLVDEYNSLVNQYNQLAQTTKNVIDQYNSQVNIYNNCVKGT